MKKLALLAAASCTSLAVAAGPNGRNAPPLAVFEYANLPPGLYDITGVLVGTGGKRATVSRLVYVVPARGSGH